MHWSPSPPTPFYRLPHIVSGILIILPGLVFFFVTHMRKRMMQGCGCNSSKENKEIVVLEDDVDEEKVLEVTICAMDASDDAVHLPLVLGHIKLLKQDTASVLDEIGRMIHVNLKTRLELTHDYLEENILFVKRSDGMLGPNNAASAVYNIEIH